MRLLLFAVEISVDLDILFPLAGDIGFLKDSSHRASRFTGTTINTLIRINIELLSLVKVCLSRGRMDTIDWANIGA